MAAVLSVVFKAIKPSDKNEPRKTRDFSCKKTKFQLLNGIFKFIVEKMEYLNSDFSFPKKILFFFKEKNWIFLGVLNTILF